MKSKSRAVFFFTVFTLLLILISIKAEVAAQDPFIDATNRGWEQGVRMAESVHRQQMQQQQLEMMKQKMDLEMQLQKIELERQRMALERERSVMENLGQSSLNSEQKKAKCYKQCAQLFIGEQIRTQRAFTDEEMDASINNCMILLCSD